MIAYGCCVGDWGKFEQYVAPRSRDRQIMALAGQPGIVTAYNAILAWAAGLRQLDALVLLHDDLEITDPAAEEKFLLTLADPEVWLVGVAGGGGESIYWWNHSPVGHQQTDVRLIDFGPRAGDVTLVEGSCMVLAPEMVRTMRFDPRMTGFHGYDEIGRRVREVQLRRVVVADVDTHHHNPEGYASEQSAESCRDAAALYAQMREGQA